MAIEVRQWSYAHWVGLFALDNDREPESELTQPDGHRIQIDAEDRRRENPAPDIRDRVRFAEPMAERRDSLQHVNQESARAARRIENSDASKRGRPVITVGEGGKRMLGDIIDELLWGVEGAARLSIRRGHQRLEGLAEDLRIDRCLRPTGGVLATAEP